MRRRPALGPHPPGAAAPTDRNGHRMLPVETTPADWPQTFRRRVTVCKAWQVTGDNLRHAAAWVNGHTWANSVVVPDGNGGELTAAPGDVILRFGTRHAVMPADMFDAAWYCADLQAAPEVAP